MKESERDPGRIQDILLYGCSAQSIGVTLYGSDIAALAALSAVGAFASVTGVE